MWPCCSALGWGEGLSAPHRISAVLAVSLSAHPTTTMHVTHARHLLPYSIIVLSSQQPASQNLTKESGEMGGNSVPENVYSEPKLRTIALD